MKKRGPQFYQTLNQTPRNPKHGKHWRTTSQAHRNPSHRTSNVPGWTIASYSLSDLADTLYTRPEPPPLPTIPYAGIRTGEIIGWRNWFVFMVGGQPRLGSIAHSHVWVPGVVETGKIDEWVTMSSWPWYDAVLSGIYAWDNQRACEQAFVAMCEYLFHRRNDEAFRPITIGYDPYVTAYGVACGTVKLWGEVVTHRDGYRAAHAKVHSIRVALGDDDCTPNLQKIYGVTDDHSYIGAPWDEEAEG